jgi:hypothetical protein
MSGRKTNHPDDIGSHAAHISFMSCSSSQDNKPFAKRNILRRKLALAQITFRNCPFRVDPTEVHLRLFLKMALRTKTLARSAALLLPGTPLLPAMPGSLWVRLVLMERVVDLHIEKLPEGGYLATSEEVQGLIA